jgi:hypothetical protein
LDVYAGRQSARATERKALQPSAMLTREPSQNLIQIRLSKTLEPEIGDSSAWVQIYHYFMGNREKFLEHNHQRSNA